MENENERTKTNKNMDHICVGAHLMHTIEMKMDFLFLCFYTKNEKLFLVQKHKQNRKTNPTEM